MELASTIFSGIPRGRPFVHVVPKHHTWVVIHVVEAYTYLIDLFKCFINHLIYLYNLLYIIQYIPHI